ncbi:hypothetical protein DER29_3776 [Micromonospora sp. M71_S20]|uniref:hypothetical protein n=1 Tax=Micromonospora sp. M71_S20 TaxID=592872 RepID=UPI000F2CE51E|nr:hypothetical protein [Micromonospora sp. M71_S20]RLK25766.1 hypothetical protein DER29_3776 [Micromonospora sp. M71_S20]
MTQPNDPTEALPTHRQPGEPTEALPTYRQSDDDAATARFDVRRPQPPAGPTTHLPLRDATVYLAAGEPTARLASGDATVYPAAGQPTVHRVTGQPTARPTRDEATVHLTRDEPTARLTRDEATVHPAQGEATVHLAYGEPTTPQRAPGGRTGPWPAAHPAPGQRSPGATAAGAGHETATGRTTGFGPGTLFGGPTGAAGTAPGGPTGAAGAVPGGEVRFGPGVPATPPSAPAWPAPAPPRRRPVWRTVTSVLSTLLTVALLAVVGLYLWQRISPLEVTGVTVAVPQPAGDRCDVTVDVVATVSTNGRAGEIRYQWLRTGSAPGSLLTERVGRGQRTVELTLRWAFSGVGSTTETATVNITSPAPVQAETPVSYDCRRR